MYLYVCLCFCVCVCLDLSVSVLMCLCLFVSMSVGVGMSLFCVSSSRCRKIKLAGGYALDCDLWSREALLTTKKRWAKKGHQFLMNIMPLTWCNLIDLPKNWGGAEIWGLQTSCSNIEPPLSLSFSLCVCVYLYLCVSKLVCVCLCLYIFVFVSS